MSHAAASTGRTGILFRLNGAKEFQEPQIPGTTDGRRPADDAGKALSNPLTGDLLAHELSLLIDVARLECTALIGGNRHTAMHSDGTAVDHSPHTVNLGGIQNGPHTVGVYIPVRLIREPGLPIRR